jgi:predicted PurR-regulated permease PerM
LGILGLILGPVVFAVLITVWQDVTGDEKLIEPEMDHPESSG